MAQRRRTTAVTKKTDPSYSVVGVVRRPEEDEPQPKSDSDSDELQTTIFVTAEILGDSLTEYQSKAMRTRMAFGDRDELITFSAMEIAAESGEISNIVYKHIFQGHPLDTAGLMEEIGDVMWGLASLADSLGSNLHDIGILNIDKLAKRYSNGRFTTADSIARLDHQKVGGETPRSTD